MSGKTIVSYNCSREQQDTKMACSTSSNASIFIILTTTVQIDQGLWAPRRFRSWLTNSFRPMAIHNMWQTLFCWVTKNTKKTTRWMHSTAKQLDKHLSTITIYYLIAYSFDYLSMRACATLWIKKNLQHCNQEQINQHMPAGAAGVLLKDHVRLCRNGKTIKLMEE